MKRRLEAAAAKVGAAHFGELQHRLLYEPEIFSVVLDMLTVRVTEMFRDPDFYRAVRDLVLPMLRTYPQLKIWHAGCASGEEVYATAILLADAGIYDRVQIYATDVSAAAVAQARDGVYSEASFDQFEANYRAMGGNDLARYFSRAYGSVSVLPSLKRNVHVFQHDLVSDYSLGEMQLVFCRNVLIYFGLALRRRVLGLFDEALSGGGFLCLGASEALPTDESEKYRQLVPTLRIFQRRSQA
jgi:chemotaxis protein methyltransferase CheR